MSLVSKKMPFPRANLKPGECMCDHCVGKCCRYFSLPIETPTTWDDFDAVRWYLAHGQTVIYVDKNVWHLLVLTKCQYLQADYKCGIYYNRPKVCRDYSADECEYDEGWIFEKVFETPEQLWEYAEALLPPKRRKRPEGPTLVTIQPAPNGTPHAGHQHPIGPD
ncbi:MAG: YkgJ family cysteine cluster protein [Isosphaeraceae bacterium]